MHANVFDFSQMLASSKEPYVEFLRVPSLSVGMYILRSERQITRHHTAKTKSITSQAAALQCGPKLMVWPQPSMWIRARSFLFQRESSMRSMTSSNASPFWYFLPRRNIRRRSLMKRGGIRRPRSRFYLI